MRVARSSINSNLFNATPYVNVRNFLIIISRFYVGNGITRTRRVVFNLMFISLWLGRGVFFSLCLFLSLFFLVYSCYITLHGVLQTSNYSSFSKDALQLLKAKLINSCKKTFELNFKVERSFDYPPAYIRVFSFSQFIYHIRNNNTITTDELLLRNSSTNVLSFTRIKVSQLATWLERFDNNSTRQFQALSCF